MKRYFELVFDKNDEGMCILGVREPTPEEATEFVSHDLETYYESTKVVAVAELTRDEAHSFFDMDDEESMPVFGAEAYLNDLFADLLDIIEQEKDGGREIS